MSGAITYGLIGAGMMGNEHLRTLLLIDAANVVAVADPHEPSIKYSRATLGDRAVDVSFAADYRHGWRIGSWFGLRAAAGDGLGHG